MDKCKSDGSEYLSNPPQYKCEFCLQTWVIGKEIPICKKNEWQMSVFSRDEYEVWKIYETGEQFKLPMKLIKAIKEHNHYD